MNVYSGNYGYILEIVHNCVNSKIPVNERPYLLYNGSCNQHDLRLIIYDNTFIANSFLENQFLSLTFHRFIMIHIYVCIYMLFGTFNKWELDWCNFLVLIKILYFLRNIMFVIYNNTIYYFRRIFLQYLFDWRFEKNTSHSEMNHIFVNFLIPCSSCPGSLSFSSKGCSACAGCRG